MQNQMSATNRLIWLDLEMTGLDVKKEVIIEIATVVTDYDLNVIAVGPNIAIHQEQTFLDHMDDWNMNAHKNSGLYQRVRESKINTKEAEELTLEFLRRHLPSKTSPMCGNSICNDRRFLWQYMPKLEQFFHYRQIDISTIKELVKYWYPNELTQRKQTTHTALQDVYDSIYELKYYRSVFFVPELDGEIYSENR